MQSACKAVIFDLFGTLVGDFSVRRHEQELARIAGALGVSHGVLRDVWGHPDTYHGRLVGLFPTVESNMEHACHRLGVSATPDQIAAASRLRLVARRLDLEPAPGACETLAELRRRGYKVGLISDCSCEIPLLWAETPFAPLIQSPVFSCAVGLRKPDERIYRLACERLGVCPEECMYVGDGSSNELTGAARVGMHPVLVRRLLDDAYDSERPDIVEWRGLAIQALPEVLDLR